MANKMDGITDLTKVLVYAANHFSEKEFKKLQAVIFALMHGVNYGYVNLDGRFLEDSNDLYFIHKTDKLHKKLKKKKKIKYKNNVIQFNDFSREGVKNDA
tara:strand:- start:139 stop:438 length:300 start_codon:yes stop_codon:yes gene_type:complete